LSALIPSHDDSPLRCLGEWRGASVWAAWACGNIARAAEARCPLARDHWKTLVGVEVANPCAPTRDGMTIETPPVATPTSDAATPPEGIL
jgi:hypothetical protein